VREALDLCLACKGCKNDCPTHTDMASYKAEFLSHHYEGRLRPRHAYSMGWIHRWAGLASSMPGLTNWVSQAPVLAGLVKKLAGIAPKRDIPRFAPETFVSWFRRRRNKTAERGGPRVLLFPDTFNNYFHPQTAVAATEVLEAAGYRVALPAAGLCCGRPLYDFGMLDLARRHLREIMEKLEADIRAGTPIIALEPACASVFRDELLNFFPKDDLARRLSRQVVLFGDFLAASAWEPARIGGRAIVHGHCHHKAVFGMGGDLALLERTGIECVQPEAGCCGMAGSFGFHPERFALSMKLAEQALLPAVRRADSDTYVIADGYSCREQIVQGTSRRALHLAEVVRLALGPVSRDSR
jgi:Fe-S oxidoreductase